MEEVLDSLRKIINRWVNTESAITEDVVSNDVLLKVNNSLRFREGDEVLIVDSREEFEHPLYVKGIPDETTVELNSPVRFNWNVANGAKLKKSVAGRFVQGVYLGDPNTIPRFPAITVVGENQNSNWTTLESTTETYDVSINCYIEDSTLEDGYRALMRLTKLIEFGLKRNMFPLVGERSHANLTASAEPNDLYLKVESTDGMVAEQLILLESNFAAEQVIIKSIIDETTIELVQGPYFSYPMENDPRAIIVTRFLYKCWPKSINYGFVHKDTLLKASKISWSGEEIQQHGSIGWWDTPRN